MTMPNITMPGVTLKEEQDRGFAISWQEPPMIGTIWRANVAGNSPHTLSLMGRSGSETIEARTRDEMLARTRQYIDRLLAK